MMGPAKPGPRLIGGAAQPETPHSDRAAEERSGAAAMALLQLQAELRKARALSEIGFFIANECRSPLRAQQIIVLATGVRGKMMVHTVSSLTSVDRSSPLVLWFESLPDAIARGGQIKEVAEFDGAAYAGAFADVVNGYPLRQMVWFPWLSSDGAVTGGIILARATAWGEQEIKIASYLAGACAHAWNALARPKAATFIAGLKTKRIAAASAAIAAGLLLLPVPMTAIAPVEVGPRETSIVTPGVEGIVRSVEVDPNADVKAGQLLIVLNDTALRNRSKIADREVLVADTRYKKAAQLAFVDIRGRHEMAVARSELDLKIAERDYARELLQRTEIRADRDGVAFFADKKDLVGKPVSVGEKLMEVANAETSEFRIDLPTADAIVLRDKARVKVFLDSDPLNPVEAQLVRASYKAAPREAQQFAFRLVAQATTSETALKLRLGLRGTAQIYSDRVPLGFFLFRKPIAAARQWSGL